MSCLTIDRRNAARKTKPMPTMRMKLAAIFLIFAAATSAPVAAQVPTESDPGRCAALNMAHYYLRCGLMSYDMHKFMSIQIDEAKGKASKEQHDAAALMARHTNGFIQVATNFYKEAGRELTPEIVQARRKVNHKEIESVLEWYVTRQFAIMSALAKGKKPADAKPHPLLELCALPNLGGEIYDPNKIQARYEGMVAEAKQLRNSQPNCVR